MLGEGEERRKKEKTRTKSKFSHSIFSTVRSHGTLGPFFDVRIAKGFQL